MREVELSEVETMLIESRLDADRYEAQEIDKLQKQIERRSAERHRKNTQVFMLIAKKRGLSLPKTPPRYARLQGKECGSLSWDMPEEKKPTGETTAETPKPTDILPQETVVK